MWYSSPLSACVLEIQGGRWLHVVQSMCSMVGGSIFKVSGGRYEYDLAVLSTKSLGARNDGQEAVSSESLSQAQDNVNVTHGWFQVHLNWAGTENWESGQGKRAGMFWEVEEEVLTTLLS